MSYLCPRNSPTLPIWDQYGRTWKDAQGWARGFLLTLAGLKTLFITIERERDARPSRDGARWRVKVRVQPGGPALLMSTNLRQSVTQAKTEAETMFGDLDWRDEMGEIRSSAILEIED